MSSLPLRIAFSARYRWVLGLKNSAPLRNSPSGITTTPPFSAAASIAFWIAPVCGIWLDGCAPKSFILNFRSSFVFGELLLKNHSFASWGKFIVAQKINCGKRSEKVKKILVSIVISKEYQTMPRKGKCFYKKKSRWVFTCGSPFVCGKRKTVRFRRPFYSLHSGVRSRRVSGIPFCSPRSQSIRSDFPSSLSARF